MQLRTTGPAGEHQEKISERERLGEVLREIFGLELSTAEVEETWERSREAH